MDWNLGISRVPRSPFLKKYACVGVQVVLSALCKIFEKDLPEKSDPFCCRQAHIRWQEKMRCEGDLKAVVFFAGESRLSGREGSTTQIEDMVCQHFV